ncbi:MAG: GTP 3',8-cyclase MoaA [Salinibacter sp.]|uniref:GTP 3',8-cyclase MoaA n=1 Tax=Salinibacter sp. TaxID=2065818 RepID=UPI0035D4DB3A
MSPPPQASSKADPVTSDVLTDTFGRHHTYLRVSIVERCQLRCRYCMPEDGVDLTPDSRILSDDEVVRLARLFVRHGVSKIRLTGGEPLLRPDAEQLAARLGQIDGVDTLALTTNGFLLPKKIDALAEAELQQINISLDTLRPDRFKELTRREGHQLVLDAIDAALAAGLQTKVNCVVMEGENEDELADFARLAAERPLAVRFIELMPFQGNSFSEERFMSWERMQARLEDELGTELQPLDNSPHSTSRTFQQPGHEGTIGFIASMTAPFCAGCTRLRLTADGHLKVCLFGKGETSLRRPLREGATDAELAEIISQAVDGKEARHAGMDMEAKQADQNRPMITIGG